MVGYSKLFCRSRITLRTAGLHRRKQSLDSAPVVIELFIHVFLMKKRVNVVAINSLRIRKTAAAEDYYSASQNGLRTDDGTV